MNPHSRELRVALVSMPFHQSWPSIQIALLQSIADRAGFATDAFHLHLDLAARLEPEEHMALCRNHHNLLCEWLFSAAAFGSRRCGDDADYFAAYPETGEWLEPLGKDLAWLSYLRHEEMPRFIEHCATSIDWERYDVVGFSSTYQQNVSSLALARRLEALHPQIETVFGGSNFDAGMGEEYVRAYPAIDYAVIGDGDETFPRLLEHIAAGEPPEDVPGLAWRRDGGVHVTAPAVPFADLDSLPTPSYDQYFERRAELEASGRDLGLRSGIPVESSRGCWWGQKHQCLFCGFNRNGLEYRRKSADRMLDELATLAREHQVTFFTCSDSIVDLQYLKDFFPRVIDEKLDYTFSYETKSNIRRDQIRTMYRGGVRWIQPGIESLSTHVLGLMNKGCTMLQNVRCLKWCRYYGLNVAWNLLWGFPGETVEDGRQVMNVLQHISHLEPPGNWGRIWLERFSPLFSKQDRYPLSRVRPQSAYGHVYGDDVDPEKVAFFFDYEMADTPAEETYDDMKQFLSGWRTDWEAGQRDSLTYTRTADTVYVEDRRHAMPNGTHPLHGPLASLYEHCGDTMRTVDDVARHLSGRHEGTDLSTADVYGALEALCDRGLMLGEDGRYLSLAIPVNPNW